MQKLIGLASLLLVVSVGIQRRNRAQPRNVTFAKRPASERAARGAQRQLGRS
jgi:hypothetical protein